MHQNAVLSDGRQVNGCPTEGDWRLRREVSVGFTKTQSFVRATGKHQTWDKEHADKAPCVRRLCQQPACLSQTGGNFTATKGEALTRLHLEGASLPLRGWEVSGRVRIGV